MGLSRKVVVRVSQRARLGRWCAVVTAAVVTLTACSADSSAPETPPVVETTTTTTTVPPAPVFPEGTPLMRATHQCADPSTWTTRQQIAALLTVATTDPAHARAITVDSATPVGGLFIGSGSWGFFGPDLPLHAVRADTLAVHGLPLDISIDEEGGAVQRIAAVAGPMMSAREMALTLTPEQTRELGYTRGVELARLGMTVDFAPVVDLGGVPAATVVGSRAFSPDPEEVIAYAGAFAQGLRAAGITPVLKHFPGHGKGVGDSHLGSVWTPPLSQLDDDLAPYRALEDFPDAAVMVGHLHIPELSTSDDPSSLDGAVYDFLRGTDDEGIGFSGYVYTDDLSDMQAISNRYGPPEAVVRALIAGADSPLFVNAAYLPAVLDHAEAAVAEGRLTEEMLAERLAHMLQFKKCQPAPSR